MERKKYIKPDATTKRKQANQNSRNQPHQEVPRNSPEHDTQGRQNRENYLTPKYGTNYYLNKTWQPRREIEKQTIG